MNKNNLLALLTGSAAMAVALVAVVSVDPWNWSSAPVVVAAAPQSESPSTTASTSQVTANDKIEPKKDIDARQATESGSKIVAESSQAKPVTVAPPAASPPAEEKQPDAKPAETPQQQAKAASETKSSADGQEILKPLPPLASEAVEQIEASLEQAPAEVADKPSFDTVRVEKSGAALAAGTAAPGADIVLKLNGKPVGATVANKEGAWVIVPDKPLPPGLGQLTAEQKMPGSLAARPSDQAVAILVPETDVEKSPLVALVAPGVPTKILQQQTSSSKAGDSRKSGSSNLPVTLDTVDYNDGGDIVFSGRAGLGANVRLYVDNKAVGDATAAADGQWSYLGKSEIQPGNHALRVDQINGGGKVLNRIELPFRREEPQRVAALRQVEDEPAAAASQGAASEPAPAAKVHQPPKPGQTDQLPVEEPSTVPRAKPQSNQVVAAAPISEAEPLKPRAGKIVIQPGNNLWKLSRVIYGRGTEYTVIYKANRKQIRNPNRIYPGQIFTTPNATPPEKISPKRKKPLTAEEAGAS